MYKTSNICTCIFTFFVVVFFHKTYTVRVVIVHKSLRNYKTNKQALAERGNVFVKFKAG